MKPPFCSIKFPEIPYNYELLRLKSSRIQLSSSSLYFYVSFQTSPPPPPHFTKIGNQTIHACKVHSIKKPLTSNLDMKSEVPYTK